MGQITFYPLLRKIAYYIHYKWTMNILTDTILKEKEIYIKTSIV